MTLTGESFNSTYETSKTLYINLLNVSKKKFLKNDSDLL